MTPKKFVILNNKDLAVINGSTGLTRIGFDNSDVTASQTVTFATTNPCVAIMDNDGVQWDLNSKRVWYTSTNVTVDLTDILYAKGLITTPARITTNVGTYTRNRATDTESGYSWVLVEQVQGASNVPPLLYTKAECPAPNDPAYYAGTTTGAYIPIDTFTNAVAANIPGDWDAIFTVSTDTGGGSTVTGIAYTVIA